MANPVEHAAGRAAVPDIAELTATLIHSRQTVLPRRLAAPGPDSAEQAQILGAAAAAPDHGQLTPWRLVLLPEGARCRLAEVFATALLERDPQATAEQAQQAREKAYRAPLLVLVIGRLHDDNLEIDTGERLISAGCAIQNMLLTAHALGFGAALTSGKALKSAALRKLFALAPGEEALCFVSVGTAVKRRPTRQRPGLEQYLSVLPDV